MRDTQRQKVYTAETAAFGWDGPTIEWDAVLAYAAKIMKSAYVVRKYGRKDIRIDKGSGRGATAYPGGMYLGDNGFYAVEGYITIGKNSRREWVIIHEMAHHYTGIGQGHGWKFCGIYLDLVRHFLGKEAHDRLRAEFKAGKVRYTKPRKRNLTDAQRQALSDRMAAVRAAKKPVPTMTVVDNPSAAEAVRRFQDVLVNRGG